MQVREPFEVQRWRKLKSCSSRNTDMVRFLFETTIRVAKESGRLNIAMLEDTSSRASSYFRSVRRGYKTRRMRRFRRELAYGWNRTWYPRCLHRSWNGYPRWKRRSPFRIGLYQCKSYERAVAQSPRRGIQAAARVGVYADVIDHVSALFVVSTGRTIRWKIVSTRPSLPPSLPRTSRHSILFQNDPILVRRVSRWIPLRLDPTGCCFHYILQNNCKRESDLCRRVTTLETH